MKRKTLLTIIAVIGAILGVFGTAFGLSINVPGFMAALGAILVYVFFEAKADIARISTQAAKWKDPKFWITVISGVLGALAGAGINLPISPEIIITILTTIVGILFKVKPT
jgi:uncharacterized membrane protein HdeD (DUF308 family)